MRRTVEPRAISIKGDQPWQGGIEYHARTGGRRATSKTTQGMENV